MEPAQEAAAAPIEACLLGGAIGDALSAPVEFSSLSEIRARFGPAGVTDFAEAYGREGAITDDTQMTLFTAEGLVRAHVRVERGLCHAPSIVHHAYLRWLFTQGLMPRAKLAGAREGRGARRRVGGRGGAGDRDLLRARRSLARSGTGCCSR